VAVKQPPGFSDSFAVIATCEALEADEMTVNRRHMPDTLPSADRPWRRIEQITKTDREQLAMPKRFVGEGKREERIMPILVMWAVPAVIVIGGVGYWLVHMH
jgi:hypothetical protein